MKIFVATHNQHKIREIGEILAGWEILPNGMLSSMPAGMGLKG